MIENWKVAPKKPPLATALYVPLQEGLDMLVREVFPSEPVASIVALPIGIVGRTVVQAPESVNGAILTVAPDCVTVVVAGHVNEVPREV